MSRDQRPRRAVMVGSTSDGAEAERLAVETASDAALASPVATKPRLLLWSLLFLVACAAGAVAIAVLSQGSAR